ncbi:carboxypeptidase-like regulatory domain-containing protein [Bacteroides sp. OttesenSCG-928-J23]|nr:carboxypeptidase-like regulatory domain-containing protein [Bacteroides sp. OttesenSCG-928-J23]MDL2304782.1 carboxypeptidase-like regulatory domain-containing protein [Bacteroides sp. OttesenSCG-928-D19]
MRRHLIHFLLVAILSASSSVAAFAQITVKGQVVDAEQGEPIIGATIVTSGSTMGVITDLDGYFTINVAPNATIVIKYLGYKEYKKKITGSGQVNLGVIKLESDAYALDDVIITSSIAVARKTPVAVSTLDPVFIEEKLGTQEFPELLKSTPSVYATKQGGGFGDSRVDIRGFKSENQAVMVNGVPMNDMEWGGLYWSNWAGLSDVTRLYQVQRGIGASKVSVPSVGGSINIVTNSIDAKKGGAVSYAMGNDGDNKILFTVSSGLNEKGWAFTLLGAKRWGNGYIQGTEFEAYNWFVNIAKRINDNHQLSFTAFGAPQWHNQRQNNDGLTIEGWQKVKKYMKDDSPYKYNPTYGFGPNGERKMANRNEYHKPQFSLNHLWQINEKSSLSTAAYMSIGTGGGYAGQGLTSADRSKWYGSSSTGDVNTFFRNSDGTFAYDKIYEMNEASEEGSIMAMSKSINSHRWLGLLSTYTSKLGENFDFYVGVDLRYYKGIHTNELIDLYGGDYYVDSSSRKNVLTQFNSAAKDGSAYVNEKLQVGDVVYRDYDGYVMQEGVFAQGEYNLDKLTAFVAGSLSNTSYWRYDRFYYDKEHAKSDKVHFLGWTLKGGVNYNLNENHNIFGNVGYISRAPFFSGGAFLQSTTSNATNPDAINEKSFTAELGYGYKTKYLSANLNVYHTKWMNKTISRGIDLLYEDKLIDRASMNLSGMDAVHQGIEFDFVAKPYRWLSINGMFSIGDWRWDSSPVGYFYDSASQPIKSYNNRTGVLEHASGIQAADHASATVNLKDVRVSGSAQTTAALGANFNISKSLRVGADWTFFGRNYSSWSFPSSSEIQITEGGWSKTYSQAWRIPSASVVDVNASYGFKIGPLDAKLYGNINNLLNQEYIVDATDGANHDWKTAYRVYYAFGRTYNLRLKINF